MFYLADNSKVPVSNGRDGMHGLLVSAAYEHDIAEAALTKHQFKLIPHIDCLRWRLSLFVVNNSRNPITI